MFLLLPQTKESKVKESKYKWFIHFNTHIRYKGNERKKFLTIFVCKYEVAKSKGRNKKKKLVKVWVERNENVITTIGTKNIIDIIITSTTEWNEGFSTNISAGDQLFCLWLSCQMRSLIPCVPSGGGAGCLLFSLSSLRWPQLKGCVLICQKQ